MTCRFSSSGLRIQYHEPPTSVVPSQSRHESDRLSCQMRQGGDASAFFEQAMKIADPTMSKYPRPAILNAHPMVSLFVVMAFSIQRPNLRSLALRSKSDTLSRYNDRIGRIGKEP